MTNNMTLERQLFNACRTGDLEKVKTLHKLGVDIHTKNYEALYFASINNHLNVVKYLVEKGANIHTYNNESLNWASKHGYLSIVTYLVENGANIHARDDYSLRIASSENHLNVVQYLIENGADIYAANDDPLHWAVLNNHLEIVRYLFSLYGDKNKAFKVILNSLLKDNLYIVKDIIDQHELELNNELLQKIKTSFPTIYNYLQLSKETKIIKNNITFDI